MLESFFNPIQDGDGEGGVASGFSCKLKAMITLFMKMLELPNFDQMTISTIWFESRDKILLGTLLTEIMTFLDIAKFADFHLKNPDVSRIHVVCHVIHIFFGFYLGKLTVPSFMIAGYVWQIVRREILFAPHPWAAPKKPLLKRVK